MAGKYAEVNKKLERLPAESQKYQDKVEAEKTRLLGEYNLSFARPSELAQHFAAARRLKDQVEEELSEINLKIEALSQMIDKAYEEEGITSLKLDDGSSVAVQYEPYAVVQDRDTFRDWCIHNGYERSLQLPWQTTNSIVKNSLLEGESEPPGVKAYLRPKLVYRKG